MSTKIISSGRPSLRARIARMLGCALAVALCAFAVMGLAGCGSQSSDSGSDSASSDTSASDTSSTSDTSATSGSTASGTISVISREDGSGTRGAFTELLGIEDSDGNDATTASAVITNSTATVLTTVAGDANAIGYISLGSLDDSVKALEIDGVAPSIETVKDNSYPVARPFNIVTNGTLSDMAQDFLTYILSADGQAVVEENGYVAVSEDAAAYTATSGLSGKVVVAGSSSVTPVMEKLAEAYEALNADVTVEVQQSDSSTGVQSAIDGVCDLGMASRDLKDSETSAGAGSTVIAMDGIAVIVNNGNALDGLTSDSVRDIYLGTITDWSSAS